MMSQNLAVPTKREKITFTCEKETRTLLEAWAEREGRSLSNLVERIVLSALENEKQVKDRRSP
jgi:hypothetical protein